MENSGFIFINLLPHRERQKALQIKKFAGLMVMFGLAGVLIAGTGHTILNFKIEAQTSRNNFIENENTKLENTISSISTLKEDIKITLAKRKIVESLQTNRADGVNIINELANNLPDDTYLKSIKKVGDKLTIVGQTTSNNKVSHYMTALEESAVFSSATLVEIKSIVLVVTQPNRDRKSKQKPEEISMNEFTVTVEMQKTEEELKRIAEEKLAAEKEEQAKAAKKSKKTKQPEKE